MSKLIDMVGMKCGRLSVLRQCDSIKGRMVWLCQCECGALTKVTGKNLRSGKTQSCGCLMKDRTRKASIKHGESQGGRVSRFYQIWENMKKRCVNPNNPAYKRYGGRGITVFDPWARNFINFYNDMHASYLMHVEECGIKNTTLDRIDGKKGYNPENCRWATYKEQANNMSSTINIAWQGETKTLSEWADKVGLSASCLRLRIFKYRWPVDEALTLPLGSKPTRRW